jgi:hypothetical protein
VRRSATFGNSRSVSLSLSPSLSLISFPRYRATAFATHCRGACAGKEEGATHEVGKYSDLSLSLARAERGRGASFVYVSRMKIFLAIFDSLKRGEIEQWSSGDKFRLDRRNAGECSDIIACHVFACACVRA